MTRDSTSSIFDSHYSCQYLLPQFAKVQANEHTSPNSEISSDSTGRSPFNAAIAIRADAMKPQKNKDLFQKSSISNLRTSDAVLKRRSSRFIASVIEFSL